MHTFLRRIFATVVVATSLITAPAFACGGFFCFTAPVDQSAERILYVQKDGKTTVHIQISYTGDDNKFSWVLPLQKPPAGDGIQPSSDSVFQLLEMYTSPSFQLNWKNNGDCQGFYPCAMASAGAGGGKNGTDGGVQVLVEENVGPYKAVVIKGDTGAEIVKWLNDNGYQQPKATQSLIDTYAKEKFVFLALQLQKDKGAGDIVPIAVTIDEPTPCLPIRLTALATAPDMPIVAWVIGKARAIPKNYLHIELNDAVIDWIDGASNYKTVVSKAVDLGSGHAFLTEMAKKTKDVPIPFASDKWTMDGYDAVTDPAEFLYKLFQMQLPRTTQLQGVIKKYIKKDAKFAKTTDQEFYGCIQNYKQGGGSQPNCKDYYDSVVALGFDNKAMAKDIADLIIAPLKTIDADYKASAYLTRLYTTLSAEEMTKDPIFANNPDLPDVSNQHTAEATPICENGSKQATKAKIKYADGTEITYDIPKEQQNFCGGGFGGGPFGGGATVAFGKGTKAMKTEGGQALKKVQVLDEKGPPLDIDQSVADKVDAQLNGAKIGTPSLTDDFRKSLPAVKWNPYAKGDVAKPAAGADASGTTGATGSSGSSSGSSSSGCSSRAAQGQWLALLALLVGALAVVKRRSI